MRHYLPSAHTAIAVLIILVADKYLGASDMIVAKLKGG